MWEGNNPRCKETAKVELTFEWNTNHDNTIRGKASTTSITFYHYLPMSEVLVTVTGEGGGRRGEESGGGEEEERAKRKGGVRKRRRKMRQRNKREERRKRKKY